MHGAAATVGLATTLTVVASGIVGGTPGAVRGGDRVAAALLRGGPPAQGAVSTAPGTAGREDARPWLHLTTATCAEAGIDRARHTLAAAVGTVAPSGIAATPPPSALVPCSVAGRGSAARPTPGAAISTSHSAPAQAPPAR